jgi:sugar lactone lactonase YvrE
MSHAWLRLCLVVAVATACGNDHNDTGAPPTDAPPADAPIGAPTSPLTLDLLAGNVGGAGDADSIGLTARFNQPQSVAIDAAGDVFVADASNHTIREITPAGVVSTFAGAPGISGSKNGTGAAARFHNPTGIAIDAAGNLFVADSLNATIRKITPDAVVTTFAGAPGVSGKIDGVGTTARFASPSGLAFDRAGNLFVADTGNVTIRKLTPDGNVTTFAGAPGVEGAVDAHGALARFRSPRAVATDRAGNVYVADTTNETIRKITPAGDVSTFAGQSLAIGTVDGLGGTARFAFPEGVAVDSAGNVYVGDAGNSTIRKITADGNVTTLAGVALLVGADDGLGIGARFAAPAGLAVDAAGNVIVADPADQAIRKVTPIGFVTTLAGAAQLRGSTDSPGAGARFNEPRSVAIDPLGNLYVSDLGNHTIRKITPDNIVSTFAGINGISGGSDGPGNEALFRDPDGLVADRAGNLFVADFDSIRRVAPDGEVSTFAGQFGQRGSADGNGGNARFNSPDAIAIDAADNLFVADAGNFTIRKVTPDRQVTTIAGAAHEQGTADGTGAAARFFALSGIAVDNTGTVYVTDDQTIRQITPDGEVTTIAGLFDVRLSDDGTGATAHFSAPTGLVTNPAGGVYVADTGNAAIRKVTPTGVTTTFAGAASVVGIRLGAPPRFAHPTGIAIRNDAFVIIDGGAVLVLNNARR